jgi:hypothetical protein
MYRVKEKQDLDGSKYYKIQKKFFIFWINIAEYGNFKHAKNILRDLKKE